jgi:hypothetical protein
VNYYTENFDINYNIITACRRGGLCCQKKWLFLYYLWNLWKYWYCFIYVYVLMEFIISGNTSYTYLFVDHEKKVQSTQNVYRNWADRKPDNNIVFWMLFPEKKKKKDLCSKTQHDSIFERRLSVKRERKIYGRKLFLFHNFLAACRRGGLCCQKKWLFFFQIRKLSYLSLLMFS